MIMLTKLKINNFKKFDNIEVELGQPVVFIGPNNSGKTTALQALALWEVGYNKWLEKRGADDITPSKRPGITINRKDLFALPIPASNLLWKDRKTHLTRKEGNQQKTDFIFIDIIVEGIEANKEWDSKGYLLLA
ncbi:MAG: AAA family ATPase, partial [Bacteroidetes bacterium]|nr:AAA family ATPase [Bacteroidota bacterium]